MSWAITGGESSLAVTPVSSIHRLRCAHQVHQPSSRSLRVALRQQQRAEPLRVRRQRASHIPRPTGLLSRPLTAEEEGSAEGLGYADLLVAFPALGEP
jgi:hypothetical protein